MKAKKKRKMTGVVPPEVLKEWNLRGYVSPAQAAEIAGRATSTVYGWANRNALKSPDPKLPAVVKSGAFKWLLRLAVEAMKKPEDAIEKAIEEAARAGG
jgi:hypothetical protein